VELIVMSTRGYSGLSRWLMGSVADRVVRGATVPVLLVRGRQEET
jgi:nucleotide-binding universal stress UspA family protein